MARLLWLAMAFVLGGSAAQAGTLEQVREKGAVTCGVSAADVRGLSVSDGAGNWSGLYIDFCRAVAAAVFADPAKVSFLTVSEEDRFKALRTGEIDILAPLAWTLGTETGQDLHFAGTLYYEGQGLMAPRRLGVTTALELSGADICVEGGSAAEMHVTDYFRRQNMPVTPVTFANVADALQAYGAGRCDVFAGDLRNMAAHRVQLASPDEHMILSDVIGIEPLGPAVRGGDPRWARVVRWTLFAVIGAEQIGLTSDNIDDAAASSSPLVRHFAGLEGDHGQRLGLDRRWAYNVIAMVGNYAELFARNLGEDSTVDRERHLNRPWSEGGLLSAPPIR